MNDKNDNKGRHGVDAAVAMTTLLPEALIQTSSYLIEH